MAHRDRRPRSQRPGLTLPSQRPVKLPAGGTAADRISPVPAGRYSARCS